MDWSEGVLEADAQARIQIFMVVMPGHFGRQAGSAREQQQSMFIYRPCCVDWG